MKIICSICGKEPKLKKLTPGVWHCDCLYSDGEDVMKWRNAFLTVDKKTMILAAPVTNNAAEDAFYDRLDSRGK